MLILAGTRKGLFLLEGEAGGSWDVHGPLLRGWSVFHAIVHDGTLHVAANNFVYGGTAQRSYDRGETWERSEGLGLPEDGDLKLGETWHVEPGRADGELWLGAAPGLLFRTTDGGETWAPVDGLVGHPTRDRWQPGAGGMCTHSIQLDPSDEQRLYVGISAAGVFRSDDDSETWEPKNQGTAADFLPDPYPEPRPVRPQAAPAPGEAGSALAAEPLRRLPLERPRRDLGPPRRQRAAERLRLPDRPRSRRP